MTVEIIAEIAQGFEGRPEQSRLLIKAAAAAGANAAKFQLVYADELATPDYKYFELFRSLEMSDEVWIGLARYSAELGIQLHVDIFGARSLALAEQLNVGAVKLHGTDIANVGLLNQVARSSVKRVLLGAGGAYASELDQAIGILSGKDVVVLLGFQGYPTPDDANQIARVPLLLEHFAKSGANIVIGFADHASPESPLRYAMAATAIGAGARVLEKHLTLGKIMKLEDHESALNPDEFLEFTTVMRGCSLAFGAATYRENFGMSESESGYRKMIRRHVVASRDLPIGTVVAPADVALKRTSVDQPITDLSAVYGKTIMRLVKESTAVSLPDIS